MSPKHWMLPLVALLAQGCGDMLTETPEDFLAPENFYRTAADVDGAVISIYAALTSGNVFRSRLWTAMDAASDEARIGPLEVNTTNRALGAMSWDAANVQVTRPWEGFYSAITRANLAIDRSEGVEMDAGRRAALVGEAKFLRALSYFYLVRLYGDVPLITSSTQDASRVARTPSAEVYRQIVEDAQEAAGLLPTSRSGREIGRATRGSALTLLADAHLTRGEWQSAADAAKQVIDLGTFRLYDDFLHAFLPAYENGPEHVFSLQAEGPGSPVGSLFIAFYYPREVGARAGGGFGIQQPTQWHYDSYSEGDERKAATYETRWTNSSGKQFDLYPHVYKYRPSSPLLLRNGDVNLPIYRYAEVLLIYAEAQARLGNPAVAREHVNRVRRRAGLSDLPALGGEALLDAIFRERRWELAHEGKRWFDLVRRGQDYFMSEIQAHDPQATALEPTDMLWPIPQSEIDLNPALTQNPGY